METMQVQILKIKYVIVIFLLSIIRLVNVQFAMPMPMFPPPPPMIAVPAGPQIQVAVMPVAIPEFEDDEDETSTTTTTAEARKLSDQNEHNHEHYMAVPASIPTIKWAPAPIMFIPRYPPTMSIETEDKEGSGSSEKKSNSGSRCSGSASSGDDSRSSRRSKKQTRHRNRRKLRRLSRRRLHMSRRAMDRDDPSLRPVISFVDRHGDIKASENLHRSDIEALMGYNSDKVARDNHKEDIMAQRRKLQQSMQIAKDKTDDTLQNMALISDFANKIKKIKAHNLLPLRRPMGPQEVMQRNMDKIFHPDGNKVTNLSVSFHVT